MPSNPNVHHEIEFLMVKSNRPELYYMFKFGTLKIRNLNLSVWQEAICSARPWIGNYPVNQNNVWRPVWYQSQTTKVARHYSISWSSIETAPKVPLYLRISIKIKYISLNVKLISSQIKKLANILYRIFVRMATMYI